MGAGITSGLPEIDMNNIPRSIESLYDNVLKLRKELDWLLKGNLDEDYVVRAGSVVTDWVYAGNIEAKQIDIAKGKITVAQIEELVVGSNVIMGENATLSWGQIDGAPNTTYIDADGLYTGTITADQINTVGLAAEKMYKPGNPENYAVIGGSYADLKIYRNNSVWFTVYDLSDEGYFMYKSYPFLGFDSTTAFALSDYWDFSLTTVTGMWNSMDDNPFTSYNSNSFVKTGSSQNLKLQAFEGASVNYVEVWLGSTYLGQIDLV